MIDHLASIDIIIDAYLTIFAGLILLLLATAVVAVLRKFRRP